MGGCIKVKPETICEYTGIEDKNGKEIFENDIIMSILKDTGKKVYAVVKYGKYKDENNDDSELGFYLQFGDERYSMFNGESEGYNLPQEIEIVGTVFDNKELLEVWN